MWLHDLETQRRKPVAAGDYCTRSGPAFRRLLPIVGPDTELATFDHGAIRSLVTKLVAEKLSP